MPWPDMPGHPVVRFAAPSAPVRTRRRMVWLAYACIVAGLALLLVYGSHVAKQYAFTTAAAVWDADFDAEKPDSATATAALSVEPPDVALWSPIRIKAFQLALAKQLDPPDAVLSIPSLKLVAPVYEGTDDATLDRGAGHIVGTALLGEDGNIGIAGHRDGFFRVLKDAAVGDAVTMKSRT